SGVAGSVSQPAIAGAVGGGEAADALTSPSSIVGRATAGGGVVGRPGGSAAFLDIHYHGSAAGVSQPAVSRPGGSAAFLDIHYHGSGVAGTVSQPAVSRPGGSA